MPNTEVIHSRRLVDQISSALTDYVRHLQNSLIIGISQPHSDLSELHESFEETSVALNRQKLNGDSENIFYYKETAETSLLYMGTGRGISFSCGSRNDCRGTGSDRTAF